MCGERKKKEVGRQRKKKRKVLKERKKERKMDVVLLIVGVKREFGVCGLPSRERVGGERNEKKRWSQS